MPDIESLLKRWQSAGLLNAEEAHRILDYEAGQKRFAGIRWEGLVALILGGILLACGVVLFVSAHWDEVGPAARYAIVMAMVILFHFGGAVTRERFRGLSNSLHAVGTATTGAAIALVGQIFNIQEHWPAAILLWAIAALAGWALLRDQAQQILALLLLPAWMLSEIEFYTRGYAEDGVCIGRFLVMWAVLYLTVFLGSRRRAIQGLLFAAGAIAAVVGTVAMVAEGQSLFASNNLSSIGVQFWIWTATAFLPLALSLTGARKSLVPVGASLVFCVVLPWCTRTWIGHYDSGNGQRGSYNQYGPNLLSHALVAAFAVFLIWWGVKMASRALVNFGVVGFACAAVWFYFSDIFDKVGRSLGLIGLGALFLAGGWALEKTRRKLIAGMDANRTAVQEAP